MANDLLAQTLHAISIGEEMLKNADIAVAMQFARYNNTVSGEKFGDLYGREYNPTTGKFDGDFFLLEYPVHFNRVVYFVTEEVPTVYKYNEHTGKYRESKTAYKAIAACERAINKALDKCETISAALDDMKNYLSHLKCKSNS